ncbi:MAG: EAL domain-containing protein [Candidatus Caldatribacteriota bacterium]
MRKDKLKSIDIRYFLIPFIILVLLFFGMTQYTINKYVNNSYENFEESSIDIANSYSRTLLTSQEAHNIVTELLDEKLMIASQAAKLIQGFETTEELAELAERFFIDEIYLYNPEGEIIHSNTNKYIGWKAYPGHPVHDFMISDEPILVEDIRRDTESDTYYKYAYYQVADGSFVQIGVLAEEVQEVLGKFELKKLIDRISNREDIMYISFVDDNNEMIVSNNSQYTEEITEEITIHQQNFGSEQYSVMTVLDGHDVFQVCVPVLSEDKSLGTLTVAWRTDEIDGEIKDIIFNNFLQLAIVGAIMYYAYRKNKSNLRLAYYDKLTGLPNSEYLNEYLESEVKDADKHKKAIMLLNCTNFNILNMTHGYLYGEKIHVKIAEKIKNILEPDEELFRPSTDRFIIVIGNYKRKEDLQALAQKIINIFDKPFLVNGDPQFVSAEIGIVEIKNKDMPIDNLLRDATLALSHINTSSNNAIYFYEDKMEVIVRRADKIEKVLGEAIQGVNPERFYLHYQPKLDLKQNRIMGFEALARLNIPGMGIISPMEFVDIAEKRMLIYGLGKQILQRACKFSKSLHDSGYEDINLSVNISGLQLLREGFIKDIEQYIQSLCANIKSLEFEITESILLSNYELINEKLKDIREIGIAISLDDFGTGFSSLARLRELNINIVKLDRFFISKIKNEDEENLITSDIISMVHKLGLTVVAEGVEEEEQKRYLQKHDCDIIQGYLVSKPLVEADALEFLKNSQ